MDTNNGTTGPNTKVEKKRRPFLYDLFRRLIVEKPLGAFGLFIVIILFLTGIFANFIAPFGMNEMHLAAFLHPPSSTYWLGTDEMGRDILSRLIYGARVSMIIGIVATTLSEAIAILIGIPSAFLGGKYDMIVQRFVDVWMSMPPFLVLMTVMSIIGSGMFQLIIVIGITAGIGHSRVIRSAVMGIKSNMYIQASDAIGCGPIRTMIRHILPNVLPVIIISFTLGVGGAILQEASLSFLGFGVPPGVPSWGSMLSNEGRQFMEIYPALAFWPGACLTIVVYGINMFGDSIRDLLDPRLRGGVGRYDIKKRNFKKLTADLVNR
jgi:peptide/nickel transport system permease protein